MLKLRSHKRCHWQHMGTRCTLYRYIQEYGMIFSFSDEQRSLLVKTISTRLAGRRLKRLDTYEKHCRSFREYLEHYRGEGLSEIPESRLLSYPSEQCAASLIEDFLDDVTVVCAG